MFWFLFAHPRRTSGGRGLLIINLQGIGDMVAFTSVLKHYRGAFPGIRVTLLVKSGMGLEEILAPFVDEVRSADYRAFVRSPIYAARLIEGLRARAFRTVIAHDHAAAEVVGKVIAVSLRAPETIGYEGFGLQFEKPFDENMAATLRYVESELFPRFTKLVPSLDRGKSHAEALPNVIDHYIHIYEAITGRKEGEYRTTLPVSPAARARTETLLRTGGIAPHAYAAINLGSSQAWKNWPVERFVAASAAFENAKIPVVLIGAASEKGLAEKFKAEYHGTCLDATGTLSLAETVGLIDTALLVFSNDTSAIHIAIARRVPTLAILGGGHVGSNSHYGYKDVNTWVFARKACFLDNWRCARSGGVAPCIMAVSVDVAKQTLENLLTRLDTGGRTAYPQKPFRNSFFAS